MFPTLSPILDPRATNIGAKVLLSVSKLSEGGWRVLLEAVGCESGAYSLVERVMHIEGVAKGSADGFLIVRVMLHPEARVDRVRWAI